MLLIPASLPGIPTIQVQPDQRVWCQGNTVNVTCNITVGNPENINLTFYRNNEIIAVKHGTVNGNATKATVTIALTPGINSFSCKATNFTGSSENLTVTVKGSNLEEEIATVHWIKRWLFPDWKIIQF